MRRRVLRQALAAALLTLVGVTVVAAPSAGAGRQCTAKNTSTGTEYGGTDALPNALAAAAPGSNIVIAGTCAGGRLEVTTSVSLRGRGKATLAYTAGVAVFGDVDVTIADLTITGGGSFGGGGLYLDSGSVRLEDTTVRGNSAAVGGGIYNFAGSLTVVDSVIRDNIATEGGGIFNGLGTVTLVDSKVRRNRAADTESSSGPNFGGGISNYQGSVVLIDSSVRRNSAADGGGGIYNPDIGMVQIDDSSSVARNAPDNCHPAGSIAGCSG